MYHYLKWAAFSLFLKRNLRYLLFILVSILGIYGADAIYRDLVDYAVATGQKGVILYLLLGKWSIVIALSILLVYSIMRLGFGKEGPINSEKKRGKDSSKGNGSRKEEREEDPILQRLEKFKTKGRLKRHSEGVMERLEKEKRKR